ncbi:hypothetical protein CSV72_15135 [Sporosarcina sp. P20a]|nr:hypothetical protein CSV72_15135 [Sporosarcina sp. P20a]
MEIFKQRIKSSFFYVIIFLAIYIPYNFIAYNALIEKEVLMLVVPMGLIYNFIIIPYIVNERSEKSCE